MDLRPRRRKQRGFQSLTSVAISSVWSAMVLRSMGFAYLPIKEASFYHSLYDRRSASPILLSRRHAVTSTDTHPDDGSNLSPADKSFLQQQLDKVNSQKDRPARLRKGQLRSEQVRRDDEGLPVDPLPSYKKRVVRRDIKVCLV